MVGAALIQEPERLLRLRDVMRRVGLGSSTIYRKVAAGGFPAPVRLGPATVRWRESEVQRWIDSLQSG